MASSNEVHGGSKCNEKHLSVQWKVLRSRSAYTKSIQKRKIIGLSTGSPMKELEKELKELKGFAVQEKEQQYETNSSPRTQGLNHQPKSTHGGTHGSSCICSRGCPSWSSMGGEALGPVKALCPSVGESQGQKWKWVGSWAGERERDKGKPEKGITFEM
jgi:hypothetical protein